LYGPEIRSAGMDITMIGECVQRWAGASTVLVSCRYVLWPASSADCDLSRCLLGGDEVVEDKAKVGLEDEEDFDKVGELLPAGG